MDKSKLSQEDKIIIAALSALSSLDSKVLAMALLASMLRTLPESMREGKSDDHLKATSALAAMGLVTSMMESMKKQDARNKAAKEAAAEKPDSSFSDAEKAKAQEILSAFMARSGVHLHPQNEEGK